jgi:hypothetical protein
MKSTVLILGFVLFVPQGFYEVNDLALARYILTTQAAERSSEAQ